MNFDLNFFYQLFLRRLPVMIVIFALCAGIGVAMALTLPPRFEASAKLLVESAQIPGITSQESDAPRQLEIIRQRLTTRSNLIDIANKYKVFADEGPMTPDEVVSEMRNQTRIELRSGRTQATSMSISFNASRSGVSADVVNEFVTLVLNEDTGIRTTKSRQTLEFYSQQVQRLNDELSKQSAGIVAFKEANKEALPEGLDYRLDRQSTLQERLNLAARDRASLIDQRDRLQTFKTPTGDQAIVLTPDQQQLQALEAELSSALAVYSAGNPKVRLLNARIAQLQAKIEAAPIQSDGETETQVPAVAKVYDLQLAELDSRLLFIDEEMRRTTAEIDVLRDAIEATPTVAIRLEELEREYENTQVLYNQAVSERAVAQTEDQIVENVKGERVTVIEQAVAPSAPNSPNRKLIAGGGVFAGSALAAAFFLMTELLNRTIRRPIDLSKALGIQPLVTIPYLEEAHVLRRRRALKTIFVVGILIAIPIGLWALHTFYLPLDLVIEKVMERVGL